MTLCASQRQFLHDGRLEDTVRRTRRVWGVHGIHIARRSGGERKGRRCWLLR